MKLTKGETWPELSASELTSAALKYLNAAGFIAHRQVNTTVRSRKGIVKKGIGDIVGIQKGTGKHMECEVKKIGDTLSEDQIKHLTEIHANNGISLICHQWMGTYKISRFVDYYSKIEL